MVASVTTNPGHRGYRLGLGVVFVFFIIGGIAHFAATRTEMRIVPPYIPYPRAAVLASGVCELLGALGLLVPAVRRFALWGLFALVIAVTPCHVYMLQTAASWPVPYWVLVARLPLQALLLWLIGWCALRSPGRTA
jgi:uncharacterized membrane protein